jgi:dolichol-phosphate mannosyltransferase
LSYPFEGARPVTTSAPPRTPQLSIIIPVFNERENLLPLLEELRSVLGATGRSFEIIFVNDGSTDGTGDLLSQINKGRTPLRVLHLQSRAGQSSALIAGFRAARGEILVTLDGDRQNDPSDIPALLAMLPEFDAAIGYRFQRADGMVRRLSGRISNYVRNALSGEDIIDTGCTLKAFRRECLKALPVFNGMHRFLPTLVRMDGYRVCQVPVHHRPRVAGHSKYGIANRLFPALRDLWGVRWLKSRQLTYRVNEES